MCLCAHEEREKWEGVIYMYAERKKERERGGGERERRGGRESCHHGKEAHRRMMSIRVTWPYLCCLSQTKKVVEFRQILREKE